MNKKALLEKRMARLNSKKEALTKKALASDNAEEVRSINEQLAELNADIEDVQDELNLIVNCGGIVSDVFVWHKVYGKVKADLNLFSHTGIDKYMDLIKSGKSSELMHITDGYHYHTVKADSQEILDKIEEALKGANYLVPEI